MVRGEMGLKNVELMSLGSVGQVLCPFELVELSVKHLLYLLGAKSYLYLLELDFLKASRFWERQLAS